MMARGSSAAAVFPLHPPRWSIPVRNLSHLLLRWKVLAFVLLVATLEVIFHVRDFTITRPSTNFDAPFHVGCQDGIQNSTARANATFMMLARNSDVNSAVASIESVQRQFNDNFEYPWVFLNDEPWTPDFIEKVTKAVGEGVGTHFDTISKNMWGYPEWINQQRARQSMDDMQNRRIIYAGVESYHHMCRFQSGFFYDHPALQPYKWYWRVEPNIKLTCALTYDPFVSMVAHQKIYGYTIALWELGKTVPSLYRKISDYKASLDISTTTFWTSLIDPSYAPWPIRRLFLPWLRNRDAKGDLWNMCHFWSNFEIADMEFFRSEAYRKLFRHLDEDGGFYYERWGDAPVHTLAAAMLLKPEELHHFADIGYVHGSLQYCAFAPTDDALSRGVIVPGREEDRGTMLGCNCQCDDNIEVVDATCLNRLRRTVM